MMVIRKIHPLKWWISLAVLLGFLSIGIPIAFTVWAVHNNYVTIQQQTRHECQALNFLLNGQLTNPRFRMAVDYWAHADGCR